MRIFISFSGHRSEFVALALRDWLKDMLHAVKPWTSKRDIAPGSRWLEELEESLANTRIGLLCLTSDNLHSPWIHFEAGVLRGKREDTFVIPLLVDLEPSDRPGGPLTAFHSVRLNREEVNGLVRQLNSMLSEDLRLDDNHLAKQFERHWPELEQKLKAIPATTSERKRSLEEMVREILDIVRRDAKFAAIGDWIKARGDS